MNKRFFILAISFVGICFLIMISIQNHKGKVAQVKTIIKNPLNCRSLVKLNGNPIYSGVHTKSYLDRLISFVADKQEINGVIEFDLIPPGIGNGGFDFMVIKHPNLLLTVAPVDIVASRKYSFRDEISQPLSKFRNLSEQDYGEAITILHKLLNWFDNERFEIGPKAFS